MHLHIYTPYVYRLALLLVNLIVNSLDGILLYFFGFVFYYNWGWWGLSLLNF